MSRLTPIRGISCILFLNKQDLLTSKIEANIPGKRLEDFFPEFRDYQINNDKNENVSGQESHEVRRAKHFIKDKFLKISQECHWFEN